MISDHKNDKYDSTCAWSARCAPRWFEQGAPFNGLPKRVIQRRKDACLAGEGHRRRDNLRFALQERGARSRSRAILLGCRFRRKTDQPGSSSGWSSTHAVRAAAVLQRRPALTPVGFGLKAAGPPPAPSPTYSRTPSSPPDDACSPARSPTAWLRAAGEPRPRDSGAGRRRGWPERR